MKRVLLAALSVVVMSAVQMAPVAAQGKSKAMNATGNVKSVTADSLVVTSGGKDLTFAIDTSTKFVGKGLSTKSGGAPMKPADAVAANDRVRVTYNDMGGKMHASVVTITYKAATAK